MIFAEVPLDQAEGAVLAHSVALPNGRLRKGIVLGPAEIALLRSGGLIGVTVARLSSDDVDENKAALAVAEALVPDRDRQGLYLSAVGTGRVNIHSDVVGVTEVVADRVNALNAIDPMITLATVRPWQRMARGEMVGTIKIISYAVPRTAVETACDAARDAIRMRPTALSKAILIQTTNRDDDGEKGHRAIQKRLNSFGVWLGPKVLVPHQTEALAEAILAVDGADLVLILTASATSDPHDVAPAALRQAGGQVARFGMPVDPGNLLFLGNLGNVPVIGLPGCAKSPALNGADWIMERVICGVPVTSEDIAMMGVGGLLKEIPSRGRLREALDK